MTPAPRMSIVVPTFGRPHLLASTVAAWSVVDLDVPAEIVVVDDGSAPDAAAEVQRSTDAVTSRRRPVRLVRQRNRGLAAARNAGADAARGEVLLFGDDDVVPVANDVLTLHASAQRQRQGVWVSSMRVPDVVADDHFGRYWQRRLHAGTRRRVDGGEMGVGGFWFATASIDRETFVRHRFDETFDGYGWEEHELGLRLHRAGVRARFLAAATVDHHDRVTLDGQLAKMEAMGRSAWTFTRMHPGPRVAVWTGTARVSRWLRRLLRIERRGDALRSLGLDAYTDVQYAAMLEGAYARGLRLGRDVARAGPTIEARHLPGPSRGRDAGSAQREVR